MILIFPNDFVTHGHWGSETVYKYIKVGFISMKHSDTIDFPQGQIIFFVIIGLDGGLVPIRHQTVI